LDIGFRVAVFVRDFEPAAEVDEFQVIEPGDEIEEDGDAFDEDIGIYDLAACMDVEIGHFEVVLVDEVEDFVDLVDGDAEFALIMTGGDLEIAASHDVGAEADTDGIGPAEFPAEFLQVGEAVDVDDDTKGLRFFYLVETDAVRGVEHPFRREAGMEAKPHFIHRAAVHVSADIADIPQYIDIGEGFAGVEEQGITVAEGRGQLVVLPFDLSGVVCVQRGAELLGELGKEGW
jgi:hypothetical protein